MFRRAKGLASSTYAYAHEAAPNIQKAADFAKKGYAHARDSVRNIRARGAVRCVRARGTGGSARAKRATPNWPKCDRIEACVVLALLLLCGCRLWYSTHLEMI